MRRLPQIVFARRSAEQWPMLQVAHMGDRMTVAAPDDQAAPGVHRGATAEGAFRHRMFCTSER